MEEKKIKGKYLPIGTVVMLKGGTKRVMIIGFCVTNGKDKNVYDYSGCLYPEGLLSSDEICMFNHDLIESVFHMGLENDEEEKTFKDKLKEIVTNNESETK